MLLVEAKAWILINRSWTKIIDCLYNVNKVKPSNIMLPKTSAYVKSYDGQTKWIYFWLRMMTYQKNIILFGIKSVPISKKNLISALTLVKQVHQKSELVYNKIYLKTKVKSHGNEVVEFYDKKTPKLDSNHTYLALISLDSSLKKNDNSYPQVFSKE